MGDNIYPPGWEDSIHEDARPFYDGTFFPTRPRDSDLEHEDPGATSLCLMCNQEGSSKCGQCKAPYCSQACQQKDWQFHKLICKALSTKFADSNCPPMHYRALFFSQNKSKPVFIWVKDVTGVDVTEEMLDGHCREIDNLIYDDSNFHPSTRLPTTMQDAITVNHTIPNRRCGRGIKFNTLSRIRPQNSHGVGSPGTPADIKMNESIVRLSPAGHARVQYGSAVFWAYNYQKGPLSRDAPYFQRRASLMVPNNFTARDFRSVIDFLQNMKPNPCVIDPDRFALYHDCGIMPAIKINCDGDILRFQPFIAAGTPHLPRYQNVIVPARVLDRLQYSAPWAELLGLDWNVRSCYTDIDLEDDEVANTHARFLHPGREKVNYGDTTVPHSIAPVGGSVLVMRKDGKPIHRLHVQWITAYLSEITAERGERLKYLQVTMAKGRKVQPGWGDLKSSWRAYLEKNKESEEGVPDPYDLEVA